MKETLDYGVAYVTCPSQEEAETIAQTVVEKRLAACVNIMGPITSIYRWEGDCQKDTEWLLMLKTEQRQAEALEKCIKQLHTYTVPEFIFLPILLGSQPYLNWMTQSLSES